MPDAVLAWGIDLILQLQSSLGDWAIGPLNFFTFLGYEEWFLLMMPFVFWCVEARLGVRLAVYLVSAGYLTAILKVVFHAPRPYWYDPRIRLLTEGDPYFGIPSGHSLIGAAVWGALAASARKPWAWIAAAVIVFLIGYSRIALGVHFPTDVIAGWAIGAVFLSLALSFESRIVTAYRRLPFSRQIALMFGISMLLILAGFWMNDLVEARYVVPEAWVATALAAGHGGEIDPYLKEVYITNAAVLFGAVTGYTWLIRLGGFAAGGPWPRRILRYAFGMVVAVAIWAGLDAVFAAIAEDATLLGIVLRFIRYGLIGFWVGGLAPRVFIRLGWAKGEE
ncbi:MAG TPA: phosphatase PAP2 family protein [Anaerolineales bacterium]|nr:phosphatase PAP2 family protein [Anaerolineales bacterium]